MNPSAVKNFSTGVSPLDQIMGGLMIGDNVLWYDDAGSLAGIFCTNFLMASKAAGRPFIYVSLDRSPRNLLDKLGPLAEYEKLTILDCLLMVRKRRENVFSTTRLIWSGPARLLPSWIRMNRII
ncbi:MAG: hypothetical protein R2860_15710 [Desulfobacterales bacterium]